MSLYNSPGECGYTRKADIFKPAIGAINGYAFAAGLETALLADIRMRQEAFAPSGLITASRSPRSGADR